MDDDKVLIVEDEQKIANTLKLGLTEHEFYVDVAYDGNLGYELFEANKYDLIVLDINLPGLNGYDFCKQVRKGNADIPIIMLTALSSLDDKIEGYDVGADDYLIKPFEFRELLMKISVLLRRTKARNTPDERVLRAADLEMNVDRMEVKRGNVLINLTSKEFQLLEYLLRNQNRVLSRANIAINVWDIDFDTNTNVIDVYINYVRNKIDKPFERKLIQTQIGKGYVLKGS